MSNRGFVFTCISCCSACLSVCLRVCLFRSPFVWLSVILFFRLFVNLFYRFVMSVTVNLSCYPVFPSVCLASLSLSLCLSVSVKFWNGVCLIVLLLAGFFISVCVYMLICLSVEFWNNVCLSVLLLSYFCVYRSVCLPFYLSVCLSVCASVCLSTVSSRLLFFFRTVCFSFCFTGQFVCLFRLRLCLLSLLTVYLFCLFHCLYIWWSPCYISASINLSMSSILFIPSVRRELIIMWK